MISLTQEEIRLIFKHYNMEHLENHDYYCDYGIHYCSFCYRHPRENTHVYVWDKDSIKYINMAEMNNFVRKIRRNKYIQTVLKWN